MGGQSCPTLTAGAQNIGFSFSNFFYNKFTGGPFRISVSDILNSVWRKLAGSLCLLSLKHQLRARYSGQNPCLNLFPILTHCFTIFRTFREGDVISSKTQESIN